MIPHLSSCTRTALANANDGARGIRYAMRMLLRNILEIRDETPRSAPLNMALDETLLASARAPLLRIYRWERPAVSFGYFGKFASLPTSWPGREIVRRMTGGGVVPHGRDLTYSLIVPGDHAFAALSPRDVYRAVHETIAGLLAGNGMTPALAARPGRAGTGVCFESPAEFDLLALGKKIAGAAMRRTKRGLLLQGSIQEIADLEMLRPRLASAFATKVIAVKYEPQQFAAAESLAAEKYATREWTMRV